MEKLFRHYPEAISNTACITDQCNVDLDFSSSCFPNFSLPDGDTADSYLERLCWQKVGNYYTELTEKVRRKPYSVVLLDEIEKAHPDVFNLLLQMLEDGRLTDSFGRKVDFKNTILIMTSNIGAEMLKKQGSIGFKSQAEEVTHQGMKDRLLDEVKKVFKPEFLNRVDDIIVFRSLTKEDLGKIVELEIKDVEKRLRDKNIHIELTKESKDFLIEKGFDKTFGARPLKRTIQRFLEDPLAEDIIKGTFKDGGKVAVTAKVDHLEFKAK